jgi:hypothetical protein
MSWNLTKLCACLALLAQSAFAQDPTDFGREIQPILSENCYFCHGPDANHREADLRLDIEEDAQRAIERGDADSSDLYWRITTDDPDLRMPPPDSNRQLTPEQIQKIRTWIDEGAPWNQHWAFAPIVKKELPGNSAIDWFVDRELKQQGLQRSTAASKEVLIRRVSLDLTGLPPSREEIEFFLNDHSKDAYARMVERYLESPAFGERMAWDWLDAARYADTNGYQGDNERTMWPWRDWVVEAFNRNMPFDQFSIWQLAGDRLPSATREQILATGFLRNHPINGEGGRIAEENRIDYVMDMTETTGTVWLGLTFNCCRCHDHKYDRLTQDDYYRMFAFFNQTPVDGEGGNPQTPPVLAVPSERQQRQQSELCERLTELEQKLADRYQQISGRQAAWEDQQLVSIPGPDSWVVLDATAFSADQSMIKKLPDGSLLAFGPNPDNDNFRVIGKAELANVSAVRLEAIPHPSMTAKGLSRSGSSNFVLTDFEFWYRKPGGEFERPSIDSAIASFSQTNHDIGKAIDDHRESGWAVWNGSPVTEPQEAVFILGTPLDLPEDSELKIVLKHQSKHKQHLLGRFRISLTQVQNPKIGSGDSDLLAAIQTPSEQRDKKQQQRIKTAFAKTDSAYQAMQEMVDSVDEELRKLDGEIPKVMVMADQDQTRKSFRLDRGSYQNPSNEVSAGVPQWLPPLTSRPEVDRLALARWMFSSSNPLTPRVAANRLWAKFMGVGIVKTTEDFGVQGEPPSHPELLDWLAAEYRDSDWNTKHMIRLILLSQTYQQTSKITGQRWQQDPENRLYSRASRFRLPSWMLRDQALAASGLLVRQLGGQPVNSYQPPGVWEEASFGNKKYEMDKGAALYRRSLYTFWRRIAPPTMFFDNADRLTCSVKSLRTNTPLHALNTLNDTTFVESARVLATNALDQHFEADADRLNDIFLRVVARRPKTEETKILIAALNRTRKQFADHPTDAKALIAVGISDTPIDVDAIELASWTSLCLAVMNLDEALTRN